jgi:hypothetical protein
MNAIRRGAHDIVSNLDGRFFDRFPARRHRVRLASEIEEDFMRMVDGSNPEDGEKLFTVVKFDSGTSLMTRYIMLPEDFETDLDESGAQTVWEQAALPPAAASRGRNGLHKGKP